MLVNNSGSTAGSMSGSPIRGMFDHVLARARIGLAVGLVDGTLPAVIEAAMKTFYPLFPNGSFP